MVEGKELEFYAHFYVFTKANEILKSTWKSFYVTENKIQIEKYWLVNLIQNKWQQVILIRI